MNSQPKPKTGINAYSRLLKYVLPYKGLFVISFVAYIIASTTQPLFAELIKHIIDTLQTEDRSNAGYLPLLFSGLIIGRSVSTFIGAYFVNRVSTYVVHDLRCVIFKAYSRLPVEFFDRNNSGYLISRITNNVGQVTTAATDALRTIIREGMTVIGLVGYLFYINWQLSLVFLTIAPLIAIVVSVVSRRLRKLSKRIQESVGDLTRIVSEIVGNPEVVKSYGGEAYEIRRFTKQSNYHRNQSMKLAVATGIQNPIMQVIVAVSLSGLMYFALILMNQSSAGEFVAYLVAAFMLPSSIKFISSANAQIQQGMAAAESLFEVLDEAAEIDQGDVVLPDCRGEIEFKNVSFTYANAKQPALNNINFKIEAGQTVALIGASGSGKTTLVHLLMRFHAANGQILLDGNDITNITLASLRQQIALVNQQITLFDDTVLNNITYGSNSDRERAASAAQNAYASEFIEQMPDGFDSLVGEHGTKLSGGQCQRLALARAVYKGAPILILDEATSALDVISEKYIQQALENIQKDKTSVIIAHRLSTIENADVIFVMQNSEVVEKGSHKKLLEAGGVYAKLHAMQFKGIDVNTKI